jgi:hypothetical protein
MEMSNSTRKARHLHRASFQVQKAAILLSGIASKKNPGNLTVSNAVKALRAKIAYGSISRTSTP